MKNIAIILGGGTSQRCGFDKLFIEKYGKPVIFQTLETFQVSQKIDEILLVLHKKNLEKTNELKNYFPKIKEVIPSGKERVFSLQNAINSLKYSKNENSRIIVHNGANPKILQHELETGIELAKEKKNILFGFFAHDSIKKVINKKVTEILNRDEIFHAQTPQISDLNTFIKAFNKVDVENKIIRDEAELLSHIGEDFNVFECSSENQKVTFAHDFNTNTHNFRTGIGEDSHRFSEMFNHKKPVILGGVRIKCEKSLLANSDGDVILHSLVNALLASVGGKTLAHIADNIYKKGITNSKEYVYKTLKVVRQEYPNFEIQNVSFSLECKTPKISSFHDDIQKNIASILNIQCKRVGINYSSGENLSDYGRGIGIRCLCSIFITL